MEQQTMKLDLRANLISTLSIMFYSDPEQAGAKFYDQTECFKMRVSSLFYNYHTQTINSILVIVSVFVTAISSFVGVLEFMKSGLVTLW